MMGPVVVTIGGVVGLILLAWLLAVLVRWTVVRD